ncbi:MAG: hypothetical protein V4719_00540 [Planctomycetota bacterium]
MQAEFIGVDFDMITAGGWSGRWDMNAGSATPTPRRATSTIPSGGNSINVFTILVRNKVSAEPWS